MDFALLYLAIGVLAAVGLAHFAVRAAIGTAESRDDQRVGVLLIVLSAVLARGEPGAVVVASNGRFAAILDALALPLLLAGAWLVVRGRRRSSHRVRNEV